MASGSRTVLLSRWRTGGATSVAATGSFLEELSALGAAEAWQKSLVAMRDSNLDAEREPRLRRLPAGQKLKAEHPFFWAGFLLIDSGSVDQDADPEADPGANPKPLPPAVPAPAAKAGDAKAKPKPTDKKAAGTAGGLPTEKGDGKSDDPPAKLNLDRPEEAAGDKSKAADADSETAPADDPQ